MTRRSVLAASIIYFVNIPLALLFFVLGMTYAAVGTIICGTVSIWAIATEIVKL